MEVEKQRQGQTLEKIKFDMPCDESHQQHLPLLKSRTEANYRIHIKRLKLLLPTAASTRFAKLVPLSPVHTKSERD